MSDAGEPIYKRVLLKLSGEALMGNGHFGIDPAVIDSIASEISALVKLGVEIGIVVGGGNLFRGAALSEIGLGRVTGDQMGMLATVMNALALRDAFNRAELPTEVMSAVPLSGICEHYNHRTAIRLLSQGQVIIFTAGIGNPFFSTDSAASLRGIEVEADAVLKATKVDGVYSADPEKNPGAERYHQLSYQQVLEQGLQVMDSTAICLCKEHSMPIRVFNMNKPGSLNRVIMGDEEGTVISEGDI